MKTIFVLGLMLLATPASAQVYASPQGLLNEANRAQAAEAAILTDYMGTYTLAAGLPDPVANATKRILVTDLGGGPAYLRATNGCWKRVSTTTAAIQTVSVGTSVAIDGLSSSPIVGLSGSAFAAKATITVTNACSMPQVTVVIPAGVFTATGALGIGTSSGSTLSVLGIGTSGTWNDYAVSSDGTTMTKIRGGSL